MGQYGTHYGSDGLVRHDVRYGGWYSTEYGTDGVSTAQSTIQTGSVGMKDGTHGSVRHGVRSRWDQYGLDVR